MSIKKEFIDGRIKSGFTLIELLVVIAIIGILSGVVLASLNSARVKSQDVAIKDDLAGVRAQAEIYYITHGETYGNYAQSVCPVVAAAGNLFSNDPKILAAINDAVNNALNSSSCVTNNVLWAVSVGLKSSGSWCIDSTGIAKFYNGTPAASIVANRCI